nr:YqaA family protein [uncultured Methylophaga sp.]
MDYFVSLGYAGLFISAFLSATLLPLSSEFVLSTLLVKGLSPALLITTATVANVLGSMVNYALGYWASSAVIKKWLRISESDIRKAENQFKKYGLISLCFAWLPIIGDPLTVMAGLIKIHLGWFIVLVTAGKLIRYIVISQVALSLN